MFIPSLIGHNCSEAERDLVALPVHMGGLGLINPSDSADAEYSASIRVSPPLVSKIEAQSHETPEEAEVQRLAHATRKEKDDGLKEEREKVNAMFPDKTQRDMDLACLISTSGNFVMLLDFDMIGRYPIIRQYAFVGACLLTVDHAMICQRGGLVIQRHNEIRDLHASCVTWFVAMCKLNPHYNLLQAKSSPEGLTKRQLMNALTSTVGFLGATESCSFRYKGVSSQCGFV